MRKADCVEELDLNERIERVNEEVNVDHDVEEDYEAVNDQIWPDRLHILDQIYRTKTNQYLQNFYVDWTYFISSSVRSI